MSAPIRISSRLDAIKPSITMAVTAKAAALRAEGVDIISFGAGEPDFATPAHVREAVKAAMDDPEKGIGRYTHVMGTPGLRAAVAATMTKVHGVEVATEQVIVSCGAKHSLYNVLMALLEPGDEVIVPAPYWVSYPDMVRLAGGNPVVVETTADEGFLMTPEDLRAAITKRTRALILNSPSNPTGAVYDRARLESVASIAVEHDLLILSDDIYRSLVYGDAEYISVASLAPDVARRTILVDGVSKSYAMTGWRIGYTAGPVELVKAMSKIQSQSTSGASHIAQVGALAAITGPQDCVEEMRVAFDERRREIVERLRAIPQVTCTEPDGAFYAFPDISAYVGKRTVDGISLDSDVALCEHLVTDGRIAIVPGSGFGAPGFARLSYACGLDDIRTGVSRLAESLAKLR